MYCQRNAKELALCVYLELFGDTLKREELHLTSILKTLFSKVN